jgi:16S rRNA processing protein RimM
MKKDFLETGKIVGTHGIRGEVRVQPWADTPDFLCDFDTLYIDTPNKNKEKIVIERARVHKNIVIMKIKGINTIEQAEEYRNKILFINREDVEIDDDGWFVADLIGAEVFNLDDGKKLGEIIDVSQTGANDVWHIKSEEKTYLIPAIPSVVINVDIDNNRVDIKPLKGLLDI